MHCSLKLVKAVVINEYGIINLQLCLFDKSCDVLVCIFMSSILGNF